MVLSSKSDHSAQDGTSLVFLVGCEEDCQFVNLSLVDACGGADSCDLHLPI